MDVRNAPKTIYNNLRKRTFHAIFLKPILIQSHAANIQQKFLKTNFIIKNHKKIIFSKRDCHAD